MISADLGNIHSLVEHALTDKDSHVKDTVRSVNALFRFSLFAGQGSEILYR